MDNLLIGSCRSEGQEFPLGTYRYSAEFRADVVALVCASDKPVAQVARELGVNHETLRQWVNAPERAKDPAAVSADAKDAARLRRQVRELEIEREILHKAAKYFARGTDW